MINEFCLNFFQANKILPQILLNVTGDITVKKEETTSEFYENFDDLKFSESITDDNTEVQCYFCDYFCEISKIKTHITEVHGPEKPIVYKSQTEKSNTNLETIKNNFIDSEDLPLKIRSKRKSNKTKIENSNNITEQNEVQCYYCSKMLLNLNIESHMRAEHGRYTSNMYGPKRPFQCHNCNGALSKDPSEDSHVCRPFYLPRNILNLLIPSKRFGVFSS